jgi:hypothetical protein
MELGRDFVLNRWWHYCRSQIFDFKWQIIYSAILGFIYGYLAVSQQIENTHFFGGSRTDFTESSYFFLKNSYLFGTISSYMIYFLLTHKIVNQDDFIKHNYVLPISNKERLITDITIACFIIPLAYFLFHFLVFTSIKTFYFSKTLKLQNDYFPILSILKSYLVSIIFVLPALILKYASKSIWTLFFLSFIFYFPFFGTYLRLKNEAHLGAWDRIALFAKDTNVFILLMFLIFAIYQLNVAIKEKQVK